MGKFIVRLGVMPSLLLGAALFVTGLMALNHIVDNWWPINVERLDLIRATAVDRVDATSLLAAANSDIIFAFLAAVLVAVTGLMLPLTFYLNKRFGHYVPQDANEPIAPPFLVVLRQSMWVGFWVAFCVWLQMNRALGLAVAGLVATVLILFEVLLQVRTRAANVTR